MTLILSFGKRIFYSKSDSANLAKKSTGKLVNVLFLCGVILLTSLSLCAQKNIKTGAEGIANYLSHLEQKNIGIVAHQASLIKTEGETLHLVDYLQRANIKIQSVFAPEHGFRGTADAGEKIKDGFDSKTNLPIVSLYGKQRKPSEASLKGIDIMLFDLQDVGVRFYTYLSTLHYVMEACAENNIPVWVLDRPNPNIHYIDGPVLELENKSFVGMHPVPIVYGMTIGEYAQMINGEQWLENGVQCNLKVIPIDDYTRQTTYDLPVRPSPNLPNAQSIALYPSLCLLEPTEISVGRGTDLPFQIYGHPQLPLSSSFSFTPKPNFGAKSPKHNGVLCYGKNLSGINAPKRIELKWLLEAYQDFPNKDAFFRKGFARIAGTALLQQQIEKKYSEAAIRNSWVEKLQTFKKIREKYLIYP